MLEMFFSTGILLAIIFALCGNYCFTGPPVIFFFLALFLKHLLCRISLFIICFCFHFTLRRLLLWEHYCYGRMHEYGYGTSFFLFFFPSFSFSHHLFSCPSDMDSKKWAGERAAFVLRGNSKG